MALIDYSSVTSALFVSREDIIDFGATVSKTIYYRTVDDTALTYKSKNFTGRYLPLRSFFNEPVQFWTNDSKYFYYSIKKNTPFFGVDNITINTLPVVDGERIVPAPLKILPRASGYPEFYCKLVGMGSGVGGYLYGQTATVNLNNPGRAFFIVPFLPPKYYLVGQRLIKFNFTATVYVPGGLENYVEVLADGRFEISSLAGGIYTLDPGGEGFFLLYSFYNDYNSTTDARIEAFNYAGRLKFYDGVNYFDYITQGFNITQVQFTQDYDDYYRNLTPILYLKQ